MSAPAYKVKIGDYEIRHIGAISLRFGLRELADSVNVTINDRIDTAAGEPIVVSIAGRVVLTGEVQNKRLSKRVGDTTLTVTGFSSAQRLVKSSVVQPKRTFGGLSLLEVATLICAPFGLVVDVSESAATIANEPMERLRVDTGQSAFDFLSEACRRQGCILVSGAASVDAEASAKASVRITRVGVRAAPFPIVIPSARVQSVDFEDDVREVHSHIFVNRRGGGTLDPDGTLKGLDGVATDERVAYSPRIIQAEAGGRSQAALNRQAEWEMRRRAAEGFRVSVVIDGWSPNNSQALWWPNTLYRVVDSDDGFDETMLLASVDLSAGMGQGYTAKLELMPPDAYAILDKRSIPKGKGGRRGYRANKEWLAQNSGLVTKIAASSDRTSFDDGELIFKPEDPKA